jgi:hypothetical protein
MANVGALAERLVGNRAYDDLIRWALMVSLFCLGAVILWDYGFLNYLFENDTSGISTLIIVVFVASSLYCLWYLVDLSAELVLLERISRDLQASPLREGEALPSRPEGERRIDRITRDLAVVRRTLGDSSPETLLQAFASECRGPVRLGVFISDTLYKLGLLGTVIGFILMLVSMRDLGEFDVETMREALQQMTGGMAVALLTTITGLSCGVLLRMQFNLLDRLVLRILQQLVRYSEVMLPEAMQRAGS